MKTISVLRMLTAMTSIAATTGCGGSTVEPASPADDVPAEVTSEASPAEENAEEADDVNDEASSDSGSGEATSITPLDFQAALQIVVADDALLAELKLEEPGRFPLKISGESIPSNVSLTVNAKAVEVVPTPQDPKSPPVLVFNSIEFKGTTGTFKYTYAAESVKGTTRVALEDGNWELKSSRISEY